MAEGERDPREERILVLAPTGRDGAIACQVLGGAGLSCATCTDAGALWREIEAGVGTVILAEEALTGWLVQGLLSLLGRQEPWSDLPLILVVDGGDTSELALATL